MRLTIDSDERLDRVLKVVGSLYGVELAVMSTTGEQSPPVTATARAVPSAPRSRNRPVARKSPPTKAVAKKTQTPQQTGMTSTGPGKGPARRPSATDLSAVRNWARANGFKVSDRGRVSNAVLKAYRESTAPAS
jgi:hypothetical protein